MARRFRRSEEAQHENYGEINVVPLVDVVFILLLFFVVTTVFVEETGITIDKPRAATQNDLEKTSIMLGVTAGGQVFYAGREIGVGGVRAVITRLVKDGDTPVIIQADSATPTETTVSVYDEAKLAGAEKVFISTVNE